ncbi:MAG: FAD-dependent oxidoreductase [bacterium]
MKIGIIGAGHAGVEAARVAAAAGAEVTLFSNESIPPYFRPRLVAVAFGQTAPDSISIKPAGWYSEKRIDLRLETDVTALDAVTRTVTVRGKTLAFDGLVLAAGSKPIQPPFVSTASGSRVLPLWDMAHALMILGKLVKGGRCVIVGGGILGIEAALRAREVAMSVTLVEKMDRLMPAQFGPRASGVIRKRLEEKGVEVRLACSVTKTESSDSCTEVHLNDGSVVSAAVCLVSIGTRPLAALASAGGLTVRRGVVVDAMLATSAPHIYAAGDVIEFEGLNRSSVREAVAQGTLAGENVVASLQGNQQKRFEPLLLPLTFTSGDFELCSLGVPGGAEFEEHVLDVPVESAFRSLIRHEGHLVGVQMVGTRAGLDEFARQVVRIKKPS